MDVRVHVKAGARREIFRKVREDLFEISVREEAERNEANARVIELLAAYAGVPQKSVRIITGARSPKKRLRIVQ
ncbi:MAG: DUF167 domain-containing protein [Candidatus Kaiserbacteria bacterium]|nr:MAG: DUF167 domain-containing protein [Candidatus Kaiserbacteria bacterium]